MFNIVLVNPEIPGNTGTIGRLAVNTDVKLHLIKPLGFDIDDKAVTRAGLDYWRELDLSVWESFEEFLEAHGENSDRFFLATTKTDRKYFDTEFREGDYLLFGSETRGLSDEILNMFSDQKVTIPMGERGRSLNLAVSVGIVLYKAIEQNYSKVEW
jgi:tRNA (cytidine/uridine-2'-O-)-methyltransferase